MAITMDKIKKPTEQNAVASFFSEEPKEEKTVKESTKKQAKKASPTLSENVHEKTPVHDQKQENLPPEASAEAKENRSKRISVLTTPEIFRNVNALASLYGISVNEIINSQMEKYISENEKDLSFALELAGRIEKYKGGNK